jgi:hypothetical protein
MLQTDKRSAGIVLAFAFFAVIFFSAHEPSLAQTSTPITCPDLAVTVFTAEKVAPDKIKFIGTVKNIGSKEFVSRVYIAGDAQLQILMVDTMGRESSLGGWGLAKFTVGQEFTVNPIHPWPLPLPPFSTAAMPFKPTELRCRIQYMVQGVEDCSAANNQKIIPYTTVEKIMQPVYIPPSGIKQPIAPIAPPPIPPIKPSR